MTKEKYARAYTEVIELLKFLPYKELNRIPQEKIDFFERNKDKSYKFNISIEKPLTEQNISIEAYSIIITLFRDYFSTDTQKEKLKNILEQNEMRYQKELKEKYNTYNLFKNKGTKIDSGENSVAMLEYKQPFFTKIKNWLKQTFNKNNMHV